VNVLYRAALEAGAPEDIIGCVTTTTLESTKELLHHEHTGVILSTGGHGIVKAAYSSGKPAFGVGPGNVPVLIERTAEVADAVRIVIEGKSFDYGTVCSSEQAIVAEEALRDRILAELKSQKAYFCDARQKEALGKLLLTPNWTVNPKCVGQPASKIAHMAGFEVPPDTPVLIVEMDGVGKQHPLSAEKLSPVLALYFVRDFSAGLATCRSLLRFGGLGHTCVIFSQDDAKIRQFAMEMPAFRVLVNTPAPQGSTGITTNVFPSMTLGCGAIAGNITGDNIGPLHLINIKRLAYAVRTPEEAFEIPAADAGAASPRTAPAPAPAINPDTLITAVEKYLSARGISLGAGALAQEAGTAAQVVDRFLAARRTTPWQAPNPSPQVLNPPAPDLPIASFVCEADVRAALEGQQKIYIGPKTIVTPSARELGDRFDILVLAKR
jgi:acetaldehyde dehydrogenase (acetylating)